MLQAKERYLRDVIRVTVALTRPLPNVACCGGRRLVGRSRASKRRRLAPSSSSIIRAQTGARSRYHRTAPNTST
jgi:hypothetical protein